MVVFRYFIADKTLILCNSGANVNITTNGGQVQANGSEVATKEYVDNLLRSTMNVLLTNLGMEDTTLFPEAETLEEL